MSMRGAYSMAYLMREAGQDDPEIQATYQKRIWEAMWRGSLLDEIALAVILYTVNRAVLRDQDRFRARRGTA